MRVQDVGRGLAVAAIALGVSVVGATGGADGATSALRSPQACIPGKGAVSAARTDRLLRASSQKRLDTIFRCSGRHRSPMPGWDKTAKGWVRFFPDTGPADKAEMRAMMNVWQGKVWYTHAHGGYIYNRMFDDRETWHHRVTYTRRTLLDHRPAIFVDAAPVPGVDNIRMVRRGVYLGITMTDGVHPIWGPKSSWTVPRGAAHGYFILDFTRPRVSKTECPVCSPMPQQGP